MTNVSDLLQGGKTTIQGSSPTLQPAADASSLQGTMTTTAPKPAPKPQITPPGEAGGASTYGPSTPSKSTPVSGQTQETTPASLPTQPPAPTSSQFANYLDTIQSKMRDQNALADIRAKLITNLYDRPLTAEELATLPPNVQKAIASGDKKDIEMQIRLINDQIQGRTNSLDSSVQFLASEYDKTLADTEKQKQDAINNVIQFVQQYGSQAGAAMKSLYGQQYIDGLKKMGIDVNNFQSISTVAEQKANPSPGGITLTNGNYNIQIPENIQPNGEPQLAFKNNNPGNLRYVGQEGATQGAGGFAKFATPEAGFQALIDQIKLDAGRGMTVRQFISKYAPPQENDTEKYIKEFTQKLGVPENTLIKNLDVNDIAAFMANKESNATLQPVESDTETIAKMLVDGTPPSVLAKKGQSYNQALATAKRLDPNYDPAKAELQYTAAKAYVTHLNSVQQLRLNGLAGSVVNTIDEVKNLANQMKLQGIPLVNKAKLLAYIQTTGANSPQGQLASQYVAAVNTLKEEFANLANGGYAPTEAAWSLANSQINGDYDVNKLTASLQEVQRLINYRVQAMNEQQIQYGSIGSPTEQTTLPVNSSPSNSDPLGLF